MDVPLWPHLVESLKPEEVTRLKDLLQRKEEKSYVVVTRAQAAREKAQEDLTTDNSHPCTHERAPESGNTDAEGDHLSEENEFTLTSLLQLTALIYTRLTPTPRRCVRGHLIVAILTLKVAASQERKGPLHPWRTLSKN